MAKQPDKPTNAATTPAPNQTHAQPPQEGPATDTPRTQVGPTMSPGDTGTLQPDRAASMTPPVEHASPSPSPPPKAPPGTLPPPGPLTSGVSTVHSDSGAGSPNPRQEAAGTPRAAVRFPIGHPKTGEAFRAATGGGEITLSHLAADLRAFAKCLNDRDYFGAMRVGGEIVGVASGLAEYLNAGPSMTPRGTSSLSHKQAAGEWAEYDRAVQELDAARGKAVADAPTVRQNDWHRSGGPTSGVAAPLGAGPAVGLEPTDVMRILELVQLARDLVTRWRNRQ